MELKDSVIRGSVIIAHRIHDGKHKYEVENVIKFQKRKGEKLFVRKGDKLVEINNVDLKDVPPEDLVQRLADGNPKLTIHKSIRMTVNKAELCPGNLLHPIAKESATFSFKWEMRREEDLDDNEIKTEDICQVEDEQKDGQDVLMVTMKKTSISVVAGRGCSTGSSCQGCEEEGCTLKDVVFVTESSTVTIVPRQSCTFRQLNELNIWLKHTASSNYMKSCCNQKRLYISPNPAQITLYKYKEVPNAPFRGVPVVLNFTGSDCFLRCFKTDDGVHLQTETYEKQKLKEISKTDKEVLSFLFYMRSDRSNQRTFESALYLGWFIKIVNSDIVESGAIGEQQEDAFFHVIILKQNS
ncbi:interleukin-1 family member A [Thalassophryne amazonica]|uniref:interleukin-1 family member A n=1 Tax=Thalassophryne amazonica TaxID=390379 RepID=UPI001470A2E9|nr:interleukin-1 family member A [Thalassophryne amazonica]